MKNKKTMIAIVSVIAIILVLIGVTYAYWLVTKTQVGENVISSACLDISMTGSNDINLPNQYPMSDEDGMETIPYTFTVTNNCKTSIDYQVNLESIGDESTAIKSSAIKAVIDDNTPRKLYDYVGSDISLSDAYEAYTLIYGTLAGSSDDTTEDTVTYELRLWIEKDAPISEANKTFTSKITVTIGQGISAQGNTLASLILADAEANNYLHSESTGTTAGIYKMADDLGDSYYFKGDITNNYVKLGVWQETTKLYMYYGGGSSGSAVFDNLTECENIMGEDTCYEFSINNGDEMYWKIVRINGDGTVRLAYTGVKEELTQGGFKQTEFNEYGEDEKDVGYTFATSATDTTQIDSTVKDEVDAWYDKYLKESYSQYIADGIFCNDRKLTINDTGYHNFSFSLRKSTPTLKCNNNEDKYTVSNLLGNGFLTNPVGLLTADEVALASDNLKSELRYWTMTPDMYEIQNLDGVSSHQSFVFVGYNNYLLEAPDDNILYKHFIRPVINIKAGVLFTGDGSSEKPYEIVMN